MQSPHTLYAPVPGPHLPDWIDVMLHPRTAFERILETRTLRSAIALFVLAALAIFLVRNVGVLWALREGQEVMPSALGYLTVMFLVVLLLSPLALVLLALVHLVVGRLLFGGGDTRSVMMAAGWSSIPASMAGAVLLVDTLITMQRVAALHFGTGILDWTLLGVAFALACYSLFLFAVTLGEALEYSVVQALSTILIVALLAKNLMVAATLMLS